MTKFLNISTDDLLGGVSASDVVVASQKAIKAYVDAQVSGGSIDEKSITKNTDDELQTVGVINNRDSSTAIKTWTGTLAQYNAIATKDANTLYNVTDDATGGTSVYTKGEVDALFATLYPVGSIYIGTQANCPLSTIISGSTWELVSGGKVLQGADSSHSAGTEIAAGLPNITGGSHGWLLTTTNGADGCFSGSIFTKTIDGGYAINPNWHIVANGSEWYRDINFDASNSSSIYGNSTTVQPPAYCVNIWRRTA